MYVTYLVLDPRTGHPLYVGQTEDFSKRRRKHLNNKPRETNHHEWYVNIKLLLGHMIEEGHRPEFSKVDQRPTEEESERSETEWVRRCVDLGYPLLNKWKIHKEIIRERFTSRQVNHHFDLDRYPYEAAEDIRDRIDEPPLSERDAES